MTDEILINPTQVRSYAQVLVQETQSAAGAVGDQLLVGPGQQDFCACAELRSTIPWLDAELTEIHTQVIGALNQIATAGVDALNRAVQLDQAQADPTTVYAPGGAVAFAPSLVNVTPQNAGSMTNQELANWVVTQQMTSDMYSVAMNQMSATPAYLLPDGVDQLGFDSSGNMQYTGEDGYGTSTNPYSHDLDDNYSYDPDDD